MTYVPLLSHPVVIFGHVSVGKHCSQCLLSPKVDLLDNNNNNNITEEEILEKIFTYHHELNVTIGKSSQNSSKTTLEQY